MTPTTCAGCHVPLGGQHTVASDLDRLWADIRQCRANQDEQWGGPEHDDTHCAADWLRFIDKFRERAGRAINHDEIHENALIHVAALAVAAIQSSRRKRNA